MNESNENFFEQPKLPEHYKGETIAGLMPQEVVYPYSHYIIADQRSGYLYVDPSRDLSLSDWNPSDYDIASTTNRVGLSRVFKPSTDKGLIDGYIADLRYLAPGTLSSNILTEIDSDSEYEQRAIADRRERLTPLLAAAVRNLDGEPELMGNPSAFDEVRTVMEAFDARRFSNTNSQSSTTKNESSLPANIDLPRFSKITMPSGLIVVQR